MLKKRVLSIFIALVLLAGMFPSSLISSFAATDDQDHLISNYELEDTITEYSSESIYDIAPESTSATDYFMNAEEPGAFEAARAAKQARRVTTANDLELRTNAADGSFELANEQWAANIYVATDSASDSFFGIDHAAANLASDIGLVTGTAALVKTGADIVSSTAVIAGVIGQSPVIDALIETGKLDAAGIKGMWEAYVLQVVENPMPGVTKAFVVAGSDMRGTIFGIYKISEVIGVSPNGFFADTLPVHRPALFLSGQRVVKGEPSVKYRGIFINDERSTNRWQAEWNPRPTEMESPGSDPAVNLTSIICQSCPPEDNCTVNGGNHSAEDFSALRCNRDRKTAYSPCRACGEDCSYAPAYLGFDYEGYYQYVFDFILRGGGNYLWPAMWGNGFWTDDTLNPIMAHKTGVVMGSTHQEFMSTSGEEWKWSPVGPWSWIGNRQGMIDFWQKAMNERVGFEHVFQFGLRGLNDSPSPGAGSSTHNVNQLQDVINSQYEILQKSLDYNNDPRKIEDIPKSLVAYNEVEAIFYSGVQLPEDLTLVLVNDNHSRTRTLPTKKMRDERYEQGGLGMYYHFDYNGSPRSFRWVNSIQMEKVRDEMTTAYEYGVDRIWVVNVGDLKFNEMPINYWFKLGTDIEKWGAVDGPEEFYEDFATMEFGDEIANEVSDILFNYSQINDIRKPDWLNYHTFSLNYFNEAETILNRYIDLRKQATYLFENKIPEHQKNGFYNLVMHPVNVSSNAWEVMVNLQRSKLYANATTIAGIPGPAATIANYYAQVAMDAITRDTEWMWYTYGLPKAQMGRTPEMMSDPYFTTNEDGSWFNVANGKWYGYYPRLGRFAPHTEKRDNHRHDMGNSQQDAYEGGNVYYLNMGAGTGNPGWQHATWQFNISDVRQTGFHTAAGGIPNWGVSNQRVSNEYLGWTNNPEDLFYTANTTAPAGGNQLNYNLGNEPAPSNANSVLRGWVSSPLEDATMVVLPQAWDMDFYDGFVNNNRMNLPNTRSGSIDLYPFTDYSDETRYVEIANAGAPSFNFSVSAPDWIILSRTSGTVGGNDDGAEKLQRVYISIDWTKIPESAVQNSVAKGVITITGAGAAVTVNVSANISDDAVLAQLPLGTFVETNGYVSILSKNFTKSVAGSGVAEDAKWTVLPRYGREQSSIKVQPQVLAANSGGILEPGIDSPYVEYPIYIKTPGEINIVTQWANTNPLVYDEIGTLRYGISFGNDEPQIINTVVEEHVVRGNGWTIPVETAVRTLVNVTQHQGICTSIHNVSEPGLYTLRIFLVNDALVLQKILVGTEATERENIGTAVRARQVSRIFVGPDRGVNNTVTTPAARTSFFGPPQTFFKSTGTNGSMQTKDISGPITVRQNLVTDNSPPALQPANPSTLAPRVSASSGIAVNAFDNNAKTMWTPATDADEWVVYDFGGEFTFDNVAITEVGNNVKRFALQMWVGENWVDIFTGRTIGPDFGERIFPATGAVGTTSFTRSTSKIRLLILESIAPPIISDIVLTPFVNHAIGGTASAGDTNTAQGAPERTINGNRANNAAANRWQSNVAPNHFQVIWDDVKPISIINLFVPRSSTSAVYNRDTIATAGYSSVTYEYTADGGETWHSLGRLRTTNGRAWIARNLQTPVDMNGIRVSFGINDVHGTALTIVEIEALEVMSSVGSVPGISVNLNEGKLTTDVVVDDLSIAGKKCMLLVAQYDAKGALVKLDQFTKEIDADGKLTTTEDTVLSDTAVQVKAFLWDSVTYVPYLSAGELIVE